MAEQEWMIPRHGAYRRLTSFQLALIVYDVKVRFCDRYVEERSRTQDHTVRTCSHFRRCK